MKQESLFAKKYVNKSLNNVVDDTVSRDLLHEIIRNDYNSFLKERLEQLSSKDRINLLNKKYANETNLLQYAIMCDSKRCLELLINEQSLNLQDREGRCAIHTAAIHDRVEAIEILKSKGVSCDKVDGDGNTPLHLAILNCSFNCFKMLMNDNLTQKNNRGSTPVHLAAEYCKIEIFEFLLSKLENIDLIDANGNTPLHIAAKNDFTLGVRALLDRKADINKMNNSGLTPLHYAVSNFKLDTISLLVSLKADVNSVDNTGQTPLFNALLRYRYNNPTSIKVLEVLIKANSCLTLTDNYQHNIESYIPDESDFSEKERLLFNFIKMKYKQDIRLAAKS